MDLDDCIASEFLERLFQELRCAVEVEGILVAHEDVQLACETASAGGPVLFENQSNVVTLPRFSHGRVDDASVAVPNEPWLAIRAAIAEHGFKAVELPARTEHVFHPCEVVVPDHRSSAAPRQGPALAGRIDV